MKAERESKRAKDEGVQQQLAELQRFEAHLKEEAEKLETARQAEGVLNELIRAGDVKHTVRRRLVGRGPAGCRPRVAVIGGV